MSIKYIRDVCRLTGISEHSVFQDSDQDPGHKNWIVTSKAFNPFIHDISGSEASKQSVRSFLFIVSRCEVFCKTEKFGKKYLQLGLNFISLVIR